MDDTTMAGAWVEETIGLEKKPGIFRDYGNSL
jgi:hypothetical protein